MIGGVPLALALWLPLVQQPVEGNWVRDPGFESQELTGPRHWRVQSGAAERIESASAPGGSGYLRLTDPHRAHLTRFLRTPVEAGSLVEIHAQVRTQQVAELRLRAEAVDGRALAFTTLLVPQADDWQTARGWLIVPPQTDRFRLELLAEGQADWDELHIGPGEEPEWTRVGADSLGQRAARLTQLRALPCVLPERAEALLLDVVTTSQDAMLRAQAASLLAGWSTSARGVLRGWAQSFDEPEQAFLAATALARVHDRAFLQDCPDWLRHPRGAAQVAAFDAVVHEYPIARIYRDLIEPQLRASAEPGAQDAALHALAVAQDERFFTAYDLLPARPSGERRLRWMDACARFDGAAALARMAELVRWSRELERDPAERRLVRAMRSMQSFESHQWIIEEGLVHRDAGVRRACLEVLASTELQPIEVAAVLSCTRDADSEVVRRAIPILAAHASDATARALLSLVEHRVPQVAADALAGYWQVRRGDADARKLALRLLDGRRRWALEQQAIRLLHDSPAELPSARLRIMQVAAADWRVQRAAAEVLQERLDDEALDPASIGPQAPVRYLVVAWETLPPEVEAALAAGGSTAIVAAGWPARARSVAAEWELPTETGRTRAEVAAALELVFADENAVEVVLAIDPALSDASVDDWRALLVDQLPRWNAHLGLRVEIVTWPEAGRLSNVLSTLLPRAEG